MVNLVQGPPSVEEAPPRAAMMLGLERVMTFPAVHADQENT